MPCRLRIIECLRKPPAILIAPKCSLKTLESREVKVCHWRAQHLTGELHLVYSLDQALCLFNLLRRIGLWIPLQYWKQLVLWPLANATGASQLPSSALLPLLQVPPAKQCRDLLEGFDHQQIKMLDKSERESPVGSFRFTICALAEQCPNLLVNFYTHWYAKSSDETTASHYIGIHVNWDNLLCQSMSPLWHHLVVWRAVE